MNRTIVILNLLVASISIAKPDELTSVSKVDETFSALSSDATEGALSILINKDDILSTSDLSKVYNSVENLFGKTQYLKDEPENEGFVQPEIKSRTFKNSKSAEISSGKPEEKSVTTSKLAEIASKAGSEKESKAIESTTEVTDLESTASTYKIDSKVADYLENDKIKIKLEDKVAPEEESGIRSLEINNDETNSAWDLLDDIGSTRRMFSRPDKLNLDIKGNSGNEHLESLAAKTAPLPNLPLSRINSQYGSMVRPSIPSPSIHPSITGHRHHRVPGFITIRTAVPIDFRRILSQEQNHVNDHTPIEIPDESAEPMNKEELNSDELSNAYPYSPPVSETTEMPYISPINTVYAKLAQASQHRQIVVPNYYYNFENMKFLPQSFANVIPIYTVQPNYDIYKYVTGYRGYP